MNDPRLYTLQPKQFEFSQLFKKYRLYGGAKGGGKSYAMRSEAVRQCLSAPMVRGLVLRRTSPEVRENTIIPMMSELPRGLYQYNGSTNIMKFPNGSTIRFSYCRNYQDVLNFQGIEYDYICETFDTRVKMSDGTTKKISDIKIGDTVMTLCGGKKVLRSQEVGRKECATVKTPYGESTQSLDHRFLSFSGDWVSIYQRLPILYRTFCSVSELIQCKRLKFLQRPIAYTLGLLRRIQSFFLNLFSLVLRVFRHIPVNVYNFSPKKKQNILKTKRHFVWFDLLMLHESGEQSALLRENLSFDNSVFSYGRRHSHKPLNFLVNYRALFCFYGVQFLLFLVNVRAYTQQLVGAEVSPPCNLIKDGLRLFHRHIHQNQSVLRHPYTNQVLDTSEAVRLSFCEISRVGERDVWGICVDSCNHYIGESGIVNRNCIEEITHWNENEFKVLKGCLRTSRAGITPNLFASTNPGGIGHGWVKRLWIDRDFTENEDPNEYGFIGATVYDNLALMKAQPDYEKTLKDLPDKLRRAYLFGDWDVFEGQYFTEFRRDRHTHPPNIPMTGIKKRIVAMDYGYAAPSCVLWMTLDNQGRVDVYRELYMKELTYRELGLKINALTTEFEKKEMSNTIYVDPAALTKRSEATGTTLQKEFKALGLNAVPAKNARIDGWLTTREVLKFRLNRNTMELESRLTIGENCKNLIRTFPLAVYDDKNVEDLDTEGEDHALDALRYGLGALGVKSEIIPNATPERKVEKKEEKGDFWKRPKDRKSSENNLNIQF